LDEEARDEDDIGDFVGDGVLADGVVAPLVRGVPAGVATGVRRFGALVGWGCALGSWDSDAFGSGAIVGCTGTGVSSGAGAF